MGFNCCRLVIGRGVIMGIGKKLKRALGVVLAPVTGGASLMMGEAAYQQDKASKAPLNLKICLTKL